MAITASDIKRGLRVKMPSRASVGTIYQASWEFNGDNMDTFILVHEDGRVFMPEIMNAAQMALYLTDAGFEVYP